MEAEVARRAEADGLTERTFSRIVAIAAVGLVVVAVVLAVLSTHGSGAMKNFGIVVTLGIRRGAPRIRTRWSWCHDRAAVVPRSRKRA